MHNRAPRSASRFAALALITVTLSISSSGCALFRLAGATVGNERPVEEKSELYRVADLSKQSKEWMKLESGSGDSTRTDVSDVAYQSRRNASIISLNSACRKGADDDSDDKREDLKKLSSRLFLGLTDITFHNERGLTVQGEDALETTIQGKLNGHDEGEEMLLRSVVLRKGACVYDLMYMARPKHFGTNEKDFAHFVDSLRFK